MMRARMVACASLYHSLRTNTHIVHKVDYVNKHKIADLFISFLQKFKENIFMYPRKRFFNVLNLLIWQRWHFYEFTLFVVLTVLKVLVCVL